MAIIRCGVARPRCNTFGYAGKCWCTSPPVAQMLSKSTQGFEVSINSPEPPQIAISVPHSRLTEMAARLSFCR
jgi:hypothetical protein